MGIWGERDRSKGNRVRGKKLTVTFCFIASYISIERVTQRNRGGRRGWQGRKMEKERQVGADTERRRRRMRKEKNNLEKLHFLKKICALAEFKVLVCNWSCILIQTESVWCVLEGH